MHETVIVNPDDRPDGICRSFHQCGEQQAEDSTLCPEHRDSARAVMGGSNGSSENDG